MKILVLFTYKNSLSTWKSSGIIDRELSYYKNLSKKNGIEYTFITFGDDKEYQYLKDYQNLSVIPIYEYIKKSNNSFKLFFRTLKLPFLIKDQLDEISLIKTNQLNGSWIAILLKLIIKKPLLIRTGYDAFIFSIRDKKSILKRILYYVLTQISLTFSDLYTVTSKNDFEFIVKNYLFDKSKIKIRPNWVDANPNMKFGNRENLRIVTVGRLVKQKNYEFLIKEFSDSNYTIDIIGDGPEKTKLENMAKTLNSNINFLGNLPHHELMNILSSTKYFISTSLYEGNSKVLLEALGAGCLVFATDIENNSEIITHEKTGILFDLNEGELINSFNKYIKDKISGVISENAASHILKNYSLSKVSDNEFSDYIWLLRQRG